jgi:hypothetical protein
VLEEVGAHLLELGDLLGGENGEYLGPHLCGVDRDVGHDLGLRSDVGANRRLVDGRGQGMRLAERLASLAELLAQRLQRRPLRGSP